MRIFVLAVGDPRRASSRLRVWDHISWLNTFDHQVSTDFVSPSDIKSFGLKLITRIALRFPIWFYLFIRADKVYIQETVILSPCVYLLKNLFKQRTVIFDFSDPVDLIGSGVSNYLRKKGFNIMTHYSDHIIVENKSYETEFLAEGLNTLHFCGPINVNRYQESFKKIKPKETSDPVSIGWTGSPATLSFITPLFPALDEISKSSNITLTLIGIPEVSYKFNNLVVHFLPWSEQLEFKTVPSFDLGLFALDNSEHSLRRGAGKLFVYLAAGVPFIATYRGLAKDIIQDSGVGFAVKNESEWKKILIEAINNNTQRRLFSKQGIEYAKENISYTQFRKKLETILLNN